MDEVVTLDANGFGSDEDMINWVYERVCVITWLVDCMLL